MVVRGKERSDLAGALLFGLATRADATTYFLPPALVPGKFTKRTYNQFLRSRIEIMTICESEG